MHHTEPASLNFAGAKVAAILTVAAGHWFGGLLWIPATLALIVFAYSSAWFTARRYPEPHTRAGFWRAKLRRLVPPFWLALALAGGLALLHGRTLLHWHSLMHALGMTGLLIWFGVPNRSGLGAGLWFLTVLLLFYAAYPALARAARRPRGALLLSVLAAAAAIGLDRWVNMGHALWLTAAAFVLGVTSARFPPRLHATGVLLAALAALLALNLVWAWRDANGALVLTAGLACAVRLANGPPLPGMRGLARYEALVLPVFVLHTYLFVHPTGTPFDFLLSLALVMLSASAVLKTIKFLVCWLDDGKEHAGSVGGHP